MRPSDSGRWREERPNVRVKVSKDCQGKSYKALVMTHASWSGAIASWPLAAGESLARGQLDDHPAALMKGRGRLTLNR